MIDFKSTMKMAINSLKVNKLRSALTSLGIIIGVSAVIIMLAIGTGASNQVQANMESMGSNLLTIRSSSARTGGVSLGVGTRPSLTLKDADAIQKMVAGIDALAPVSNEGKQEVKKLSENENNLELEGINKVKDSLDDYEGLIYDGAYSNHIEISNPKALSENEVTVETAAKKVRECVEKALIEKQIEEVKQNM